MKKENLFFIESLGDLYLDVQSNELFPDSKFFVDCVPRSSPEKIIAAYEQEKKETGFDPKSFVANHFIFPAETVTGYKSANKPLVQHLQDLWDVLKRQPTDNQGGTLIPLPHSYIVPGGRFREVYYWDSYFTMLGLQISKRVDIIQNMIDNFAYLLNEFGLIPNGNRTYYLGRSQPPFFALMVELLAEEKGEEVLLKYQSALEIEYTFWMDGKSDLNNSNTSHRRVVLLHDGIVLNRYWDDYDTPRPEGFIEDREIAKKSKQPPEIVYRHIRAAAESGWDFSSRWFKDGKNMETIETTNIIPVDLNCLLLQLEKTLLKVYELRKEDKKIGVFRAAIHARENAIRRYCWNETTKFYFDYNHADQSQTDKLTLAAVYPLFFQLASKEQACAVAELLKERFLGSGGVVTSIVNTCQQWDAPNGWAPLQWMTYRGLQLYGYNELCAQIKKNWLGTCEKVYAENGKMMEKYNVQDTNIKTGGGEYPNQDGFGWTNGVYIAMNASV